MAQPVPYDLTFDFIGYQVTSPNNPLPANKLEAEFNNIATTLDQILANLALIQRDDTELGNKTVGYDQFKDGLDLGFNPPNAWATGQSYSLRDTVFFDAAMYRCTVAHTSGAFAADLASGKWVLISDFAATIDCLLLSGGTMAGAIDMADNLFTRPVIKDYALKVYVAAVNAGVLALDFANGNVAKITLTANVTSLTIADWPAGELGKKHIWIETGAGGFTVAWPAGWRWSNGVVPTVTSAAGKIDVVIAMSLDGGATVLATIAGQNY